MQGTITSWPMRIDDLVRFARKNVLPNAFGVRLLLIH